MSTTLQLPEPLAKKRGAAAAARGETLDDFALRTLSAAVLHDTPPVDSARLPSARSLSDILRDFAADIPPSERGKLPRDGSVNHDHYLYGSPKIVPEI